MSAYPYLTAVQSFLEPLVALARYRLLCRFSQVLQISANILLPKPLSLLLKASPLVDELSLYDVVNTPGVTADLSHISSIAVHAPRVI